MGSRTIQVLKRDQSAEEFDPLKLAASMHRAMQRVRQGDFRQAVDLACAIEVYLHRASWTCVTSAAVFEMAIKVLWRVRMTKVAQAMEYFHELRTRKRRRYRVLHEGGKLTLWDKSWLARLGGQSWKLMPATARIIAGKVERQLLRRRGGIVSRQTILDAFSAAVAAYGLADAVPVEQ